MFLQFRATNFLSFKDTQTLSFVKSGELPDDGDVIRGYPSALRTAVVFGANASGKTNTLLAMEFLKRIVTGGGSVLTTEQNDKRLSERFNYKSSENTVSSFSIIVEDRSTDQQITYEYCLEYDSEKNCVEHEVLKLLLDSYEWVLSETFDYMSGELPASEEGKCTLLRSIIESKDPEDEVRRAADCVYRHINSIQMVSYDTSFKQRSYKFKKFDVEDLLEMISTLCDITRIERHGIMESYERSDEVADLIVQDGRQLCLKQYHNGRYRNYEMRFVENDKALGYSQLSTGVRRIIDLALVLLEQREISRFENESSSYRDDGLLMIDEMSYSLHPETSKKLYRTISEVAKQADIQVVITAHESNLLSIKEMRRDEVWFVEKNGNISHLYSLDDFSGNAGGRLKSRYLSGRYGAVPEFDEWRLK